MSKKQRGGSIAEKEGVRSRRRWRGGTGRKGARSIKRSRWATKGEEGKVQEDILEMSRKILG